MALLLIGTKLDSADNRIRFVACCNRNEFYGRYSSSLGRWPDSPHIIGGQDLNSKGTWIACDDTGKFAAILPTGNFQRRKGSLPRSQIIPQFFEYKGHPRLFIENIDAHLYKPFDLVFGRYDELYSFSSVKNELTELPQGFSAFVCGNGLPQIAIQKKIADAANLLWQNFKTTEQFRLDLLSVFKDKSPFLLDTIDNVHSLPHFENNVDLQSPFIASACYGTVAQNLFLIEEELQSSKQMKLNLFCYQNQTDPTAKMREEYLEIELKNAG